MVLVPVSSLRKALIVLEEKKYCENQLSIARDTISIQNQLILNQDTIITNQKNVIIILNDNIDSYKKIIENKDTEIKYHKELYKKEKRNKWIAIGAGSSLFLISLLFL